MVLGARRGGGGSWGMEEVAVVAVLGAFAVDGRR